MVARIFVPMCVLATCLCYARGELSLTSRGSRLDRSTDWAPHYRRKLGSAGRPDGPRVLLWYLPYGQFTLGFSKNVTTRRLTCPQQCFVSYNRSTLMASDAVVFHGRSISFNDMPKWRAPAQKWVFWNGEPPGLVYSLEKLKGIFNWTMTYQSDSDIVNPYGTIAERDVTQNLEYQKTRNIWRRKSRMAVWAASHCGAESRRDHYVKQLQKYVRVDVYGRCGHRKCPKENSTRCYKMFAKKYFFYLSFENFICRDYVTEKLFNALEYDIIPVVLGGANYTAIAPPNSFIDALTFRSPKHLAKYLKRVAGNFQLYSKYLHWKNRRRVDQNHGPPSFCDLCNKLRSPSFRQATVVADLFHWFNRMSHCWSWNFTK